MYITPGCQVGLIAQRKVFDIVDTGQFDSIWTVNQFFLTGIDSSSVLILRDNSSRLQIPHLDSTLDLLLAFLYINTLGKSHRCFLGG